MVGEMYAEIAYQYVLKVRVCQYIGNMLKGEGYWKIYRDCAGGRRVMEDFLVIIK